MSLSSRDSNPADGCGTYLGFASAGSTPPPAGSGTITFYDYAGSAYTATYSPSGFLVTVRGCVYEFGPPAISTVSGGGLFKITKASSYGACYDTGSCSESYLVAASADGVLAFVDQSVAAGWSDVGGSISGSCAAVVAYAVAGSTPSVGSLVFVGVAANQQLSWWPAGASGTYDQAGGTINVSTFSGLCTQVYAVDPASLPAGSWEGLRFEASPPRPGSAVVGYVGVSPSSCPVDACATSGYYVVWDKAGLPSSLLQTLFCSSYHLPMCEYSKRPLTLSESR